MQNKLNPGNKSASSNNWLHDININNKWFNLEMYYVALKESLLSPWTGRSETVFR